jgi:hypothetical protein
MTIISFEDLADKKVKSTDKMTVSDNTIDFKNIAQDVTFTGVYPQRLTLKNLSKGVIEIDGTITTATDNKSLQIADCKEITLDLTNGAIIGKGSSTGVCGQLIYIYARWFNLTVIKGTLEQNGKSGGAAFQTESYSDVNYTHGTLSIDGTQVLRAMGEGFYIGYNQPTKAFLDRLEIRNTSVANTRRDFWQLGNVNDTIIENNRGTNGGLERNPDHISGFSLNGKNDRVLVKNNIVDRVPQFIYSATQSIIEVEGNTYTQGDAMVANQAIYTKSPMTLRNNIITTPLAKEAAITADGCKVIVEGDNKIIAPKLARLFNGGTVTQTPAIKRYPVTAEVIESTINGSTTRKLLYEGKEFVI